MLTTEWKIDRTINLPFLVTVGTALVAGVVWASSVNNRLDNLEQRTRSIPAIEVRLARMDERGEASKGSLTRIEQRLDRIEEQGR